MFVPEVGHKVNCNVDEDLMCSIFELQDINLGSIFDLRYEAEIITNEQIVFVSIF